MLARVKFPKLFPCIRFFGISIALICSAYAQNPSLTLASGSTSKGGSVSLNLSFNAASSSTASLQWTLSYPTSAVTSLSVVAGSALTASGKSLGCNSGQGTLICIVAGMNSTAIGSGVVAVVTATTSASSSATLDSLSLTNAFGALRDGTNANITGSGGTITVASSAIVSGLQCTPSSLTSAASSTCTVSLSQAAPAGGAAVAVSDNNTSLTVPASVTVAAGAASANFQATAKTISASGSATITATYGGASANATVSLVPPATTASVSSLSCNPSSLGPNVTSTCTVTLSQAAPSGGASVVLSNSNSTLTVPASVIVAAAATSATFTVKTTTISSNSSAQITATYNSTSANTSVSLVAAVLVSSLSCSPSSLGPNASSTCTVTLSQAAPTGGASVALSNSNSTLTVPASVTVAAAATSATFTVKTTTIGSNSSATVTASYNGSSATATVNLVKSALVSSVSCNPTSLGPNSSASCTVTLSSAAPAGGANVALSDTSSRLSVPTSVTVSVNATSAQFTVHSTFFQRNQSDTITATYNSSSAKTTVSMVVSTGSKMVTANTAEGTRPSADSAEAASALSTLSCTPKVVAAGSQATCALSVTATATPGDVQIATSSQSVKAPVTVVPRANQARLTFQVSVDAGGPQQLVAINATQGGETVQETIQVDAASQPVITAPRDQAGKPGTPLSFTVTATDPSQQPVTISAPGLPAGAVFDSATCRFDWTPSTDQNGTSKVQFTATNQFGQSSSAQVNIDVTSGQPTLAATQDACSPGAIGSVKGSWLTAQGAAFSDPSGNAMELGGTKVQINGQKVPMLSATPSEVHFICPALPSGTPLQVAVETESGTSSSAMSMESTSPRIFTLGGGAPAQAVVSFSDTSDFAMARNFQVAAHPAQPGDEVLIWGTGLGNPANTGQISVTMGGVAAEVEAVMTMPGHAGVYAVQVRVPVATSFGDEVPVKLLVVGGDNKPVASNTATLAIEPAQQ